MSTEKYTGGPAFPFSFEMDGEQRWAYGATLRDYFAAKAMQSLVALDSISDITIAKQSYEIADAMIKARTE